MIVSAASRMFERDLVGRLLALGALDHRDHAVEEGLAGVGGDAHDQPVGEHARAAGDGAAVAAALADDRRALAGDGALVDRGHAFDDLAVAGDEVAGLDQHHIALAQRCRRRLASMRRAVLAARVSFLAVTSRRVLRSVSAWALPRPSAIASAKLANSTVNHSQSEMAKMKPAGASPWPSSAWIARARSSARCRPRPRTSPGCVTWWRGSSFVNESHDRPPHNRRVEQRTGFCLSRHDLFRVRQSVAVSLRSALRPMSIA